MPAVELGFQPGGKGVGSRERVESPGVVASSSTNSGQQDAALYISQGCPALPTGSSRRLRRFVAGRQEFHSLPVPDALGWAVQFKANCP